MQALQLLGLELATQNFAITSVKLESCQKAQKAFFLERKAESSWAEAVFVNGACTVISKENACQTTIYRGAELQKETDYARLDKLLKTLDAANTRVSDLQVPPGQLSAKDGLPCFICSIVLPVRLRA